MSLLLADLVSSAVGFRTAVAMIYTGNQIQGIELGGVHQGASFHTYVRYADYLGVLLRDVLSGAPLVKAEELLQGTQDTERASQSQISPRQQRERELLDRVREAIGHLKTLGTPLTSRGISQAVSLSPQGLQHYPSIKAVWRSISRELDEATKQRKQKREDELVERVRQAIVTLTDRGQYPSHEAIARLVGVSSGGLRYYARVRALLKQASDQRLLDRGQQNHLSEDAVLAQVQAAIARLQIAGQPITHESISSGVGLSLHRLRLYPRVKLILDQGRRKGRLGRKEQAHLREQALAAQVDQAMEQLRAAGQPLTRRAGGEIVGLSPRALARYHRVQILLSRVTEERRCNGPQRAPQRESELLELASQAVERLRERGQPLTQKSIAQQVGLTGAALMYYPRFRTLYRQVLEENRQARLRQAQLREEALVERVQEAIHQLQAQGAIHLT